MPPEAHQGALRREEPQSSKTRTWALRQVLPEGFRYWQRPFSSPNWLFVHIWGLKFCCCRYCHSCSGAPKRASKKNPRPHFPLNEKLRNRSKSESITRTCKSWFHQRLRGEKACCCFCIMIASFTLCRVLAHFLTIFSVCCCCCCC